MLIFRVTGTAQIASFILSLVSVNDLCIFLHYTWWTNCVSFRLLIVCVCRGEAEAVHTLDRIMDAVQAPAGANERRIAQTPAQAAQKGRTAVHG